jgi:hypothetical protein
MKVMWITTGQCSHITTFLQSPDHGRYIVKVAHDLGLEIYTIICLFSFSVKREHGCCNIMASNTTHIQQKKKEKEKKGG